MNIFDYMSFFSIGANLLIVSLTLFLTTFLSIKVLKYVPKI